MTTLRDDQGRFLSPRVIPRYRITVWDIADGDIIENLWEASEDELDEIEQRYADETGIDIQVEDLIYYDA